MKIYKDQLTLFTLDRLRESLLPDLNSIHVVGKKTECMARYSHLWK